MPASSPLQPGSLVTFQILSGGSAIPDSFAVIAVTIEKRLNQASSARIVLLDGDPATGTFAISASDIFVPGVEIVINAGYDAQNRLLFRGEIIAQNIFINDAGESTLVVECWNYAVDNRAFDKTPVLTINYGDSIIALNASLSRPDNAFKVNGMVKFQGSGLAEPGKYISLKGLGDRFNGNHLMSAVLHQIDGGNWTTEATIGLPD